MRVLRTECCGMDTVPVLHKPDTVHCVACFAVCITYVPAAQILDSYRYRPDYRNFYCRCFVSTGYSFTCTLKCPGREWRKPRPYKGELYGFVVSWSRLARQGDRGTIPSRGERIFPLASVSRPALRATHPPVQWVPGVVSPWAKTRPGRDADHSPLLVPRSRMNMSYTSSPPKRHRGV
jgi:hypothetical protein